MTDDNLRQRQLASIEAGREQHACNCTGPRNGEPLCPCAMRGVIVRDGRYILPERDLGPVAPEPRRESAFRPFDLSFMGKFR